MRFGNGQSGELNILWARDPGERCLRKGAPTGCLGRGRTRSLGQDEGYVIVPILRGLELRRPRREEALSPSLTSDSDTPQR